MEQGVISLDQVLAYMDSGQPFNLTHVTADENRGTGGEIKVRNGWVKCRHDAVPEVILRRNKVYQKLKRDPKYGQNKNRLIMHPVTHEIREVHIRLICTFNGKRVV